MQAERLYDPAWWSRLVDMKDLSAGTVTLLFSDIEASTEVMKRLGDAWPGVLDRHRVLLRGAVEAADGVVVDCQGDAMFAAFRSARAGVDAAVDGQARLAGEDWPAGGVVRVRMALHTGEPHRAGDGYTGIDVVHAARLCAAGHGGQVLLSEATAGCRAPRPPIWDGSRSPTSTSRRPSTSWSRTGSRRASRRCARVSAPRWRRSSIPSSPQSD